ncbi:hypothetical protein CFC21_013040 [Triticum aestivum]|uniref:PSII 6.1 kDa protein n=3 Tax=Triticinae TaxID=1648030 RepID=A0A9R1DRB8_WHEAT|nr:photosystem II reaction center W protein, chloroplastic-like [Aegilops tauschii subsp. strangulata]XP_044445382.1 photosystem II reaction center W protein, chloroplastic-like [Triticum aestivum]KAF6996728.1 hypothetical protein CFC21_013040 [Triticum aestivum]
MAAIGATTVFVAAAGPSQALGLPRLRVAKATRLRCRCSYSKDLVRKASSALAALAVVKDAPLLVEASAMMAATGPVLAPMLVLALVDERIMPMEGAGMNNDLLGWILVVALGLALSYTVYSSILDDDDDDDQSSVGGIMI